MKIFIRTCITSFSLISILLISQTIKIFSQTLPVPDHIVIVIEENHGYTQIIGSSAAPNINALANDPLSALFTQSYAIAHPSQPNYIDLFSGCNQGVTNDNFPAGSPFTTANLGRELLDSGKTFITYSEDLPSVGFNGSTSGNYARKHNPAANWMGTGINQIPTTTNQPFTAFPSGNFSSLPSVCYVAPNQNNDMHNGSNPGTITTGDNWMNNNLNSYIQWAKTHNSLFILTFDEDNGSQGNHIVTIFTGQMVTGGQYADTVNHYSILRTIEDMYGLPYACNASTTAPITNCWNVTAVIPPDQTESDDKLFSIYPNPGNGQIRIGSPIRINEIKITDRIGQLIYQSKPYENNLSLQLDEAGIYFIQIITGKQAITKKLIVCK